jgi:hypothetical protein
MNKFLKLSKLLFLLPILLSSCFFPGARKRQQQEKTVKKAIEVMKDNRDLAAGLIDTAIAIYPEFASKDQVIVHDTVRIDSIVIKPVWRDRPVVDSTALQSLTEKMLDAYDSLKLVVSDRDTRNRILSRKVMSLAEDGLLTRDTLTYDSLGVTVKSWFYKGRLFSEVRKKEQKLVVPKTVNRTQINPIITSCREWIEYPLTWLCLVVITLLFFLLIKLAIHEKTNRV